MYADTVPELLSAVIPGYDELSQQRERRRSSDRGLATRRRSSWPTRCRPRLVIDATENDG
ncbi:hypothetical protein [Streptomyces sp. NPDC048825]|uniref:hypothetical protein n=1 Tax=Streptomyces sp. NPDC048825 TaxID=3365592 RepID=UPI00371476B7